MSRILSPNYQVPDNCLFGYFGDSCTNKCQCSNCDKVTGCANRECLNGYWGVNCEIECHCVNYGACDRESGKCVADITNGVNQCIPGYVSMTGVNLGNCQQCKSPYELTAHNWKKFKKSIPLMFL